MPISSLLRSSVDSMNLTELRQAQTLCETEETRLLRQKQALIDSQRNVQSQINSIKATRKRFHDAEKDILAEQRRAKKQARGKKPDFGPKNVSDMRRRWVTDLSAAAAVVSSSSGGGADSPTTVLSSSSSEEEGDDDSSASSLSLQTKTEALEKDLLVDDAAESDDADAKEHDYEDDE